MLTRHPIASTPKKIRTYKLQDPNDLRAPNKALRRRSTAKARKLQKNVRENGIVVPLIVDRDGLVIDGHARLQIARKLGFTEVPTIVVEGYSEAELRALSLALNRLAEDAEWDREAVAAQLTSILELDTEFNLELTGFDVPELDILLDEVDPVGRGNALDQNVPPPPEDPVAQTGDVFLAGRHRIACGDVRDTDVMSALMGPDEAAVVITDAPYNVMIDGHATGAGRTRHREFAMASGEMSEAEFQEFLRQSLESHVRSCSDGALLYLFMDWRHLHLLQAACRELALVPINLCVWAKTNAGMGSFYRSQHELIFVCRKGNVQHRNNIELGRHGRNRSNVWRYEGANTLNPERRAELALHPTVKPVAMIEDALKDCTRRGDIVLDGFLGSGTTLLAAQRTGRICHGVEIDPGYVDLAIQRWQAMTGCDAIHEASGLTFSELSIQRRREADTDEENA